MLLSAAVEWDFSNVVVIIMVSSSYFRDSKFVGVDHRLILDPDLSDTLQLRRCRRGTCMRLLFDGFIVNNNLCWWVVQYCLWVNASVHANRACLPQFCK